MKFEEHIKERLEIGRKEYGVGAWKKLSSNELILMTQEELVDAANYLKWEKEKGIDLTNFIPILKAMYDVLEEKKK